MRKKLEYTEFQKQYITEHYANERTQEIAEATGLVVKHIYMFATANGLKKSKEFLSSSISGILYPGHTRGKKTQFKKGHVPANKGVKSPGKINSGCFKKGHISKNTRKDGDTRVNIYGYIEIRISVRNWKLFHRVVWQQHNGSIPEGMLVAFKDGNKLNCDISNLELISRQESMRRQTMHNYPEDLRNLILTKGHLTRQINKRLNYEKR